MGQFYINSRTARRCTAISFYASSCRSSSARIVSTRSAPREDHRIFNGRLRSAAHRIRSPELFGSVSAHSAALMRDPPQGVNAGASGGNLAAMILTNVFGNPIDQKFWTSTVPSCWPRKTPPCLRNKNLFRLRHRGSYGFDRGAGELDQALNTLKIPHEFHLYPGGHSVPISRPREASYEFHWHVFDSAHKP